MTNAVLEPALILAERLYLKDYLQSFPLTDACERMICIGGFGGAPCIMGENGGPYTYPPSTHVWGQPLEGTASKLIQVDHLKPMTDTVTECIPFYRT